MNSNLKKSKLSDMDKEILKVNPNICTDAHGSSCDSVPLDTQEINFLT